MKKRGTVDIGNTRIKAGIFDENAKLLETNTFNEMQGAVSWLKGCGIIDIMVSDVKGIETINDPSLNIQYTGKHLKLPFTNLYKTPETLGADRIAVVSAAALLFPHRASIIFDIGTCLTIDFLSPEHEYWGGNISPGIAMRLKAMQHFTNKLPLSTMEKNSFSMGTDTLTALANGAVCGVLYEIEGYVSKIKEQYPDVNILLCGGDAHYFEKQLKYKIFADQNLVLLGLYHLLVFND